MLQNIYINYRNLFPVAEKILLLYDGKILHIRVSKFDKSSKMGSPYAR
jgi:hypothetical protein